MQRFSKLHHIWMGPALGLIFAVCPITLAFDLQDGFQVELPAAFAKSGPGKEGDGRDDDDDDDDDDNSGSGSSNSGSGSSGSGSSGSGSSGSGSGSSSSGSGSGGSASKGSSQQPVALRNSGAVENLYLIYANGWEEKIANGRYLLKDPKGRRVAERLATQADFIRMMQAAGQ